MAERRGRRSSKHGRRPGRSVHHERADARHDVCACGRWLHTFLRRTRRHQVLARRRAHCRRFHRTGELYWIARHWHQFGLVFMVVLSTLGMALLGMAIARYLVMPLRSAPALNTLLITLMLGTVLRECVRLFYPQGANPKPFPALLPRGSIDFGAFNLRF